MYYNDIISVLESKIKEYERESVKLKQELSRYCHNEIDSSEVPEMANLRHQIAACEQNILAYKKEKDIIIEKMLQAGSLSVGEFIAFLEQNGLYYKTINVNSKTLIVPIDYCLINNRHLSDTKLKEIKNEKIYLNSNNQEIEQGLKVMPSHKSVEQFNLYRAVELQPKKQESAVQTKRKRTIKFTFSSIAAAINNMFNKTPETPVQPEETIELVLLNDKPMNRREIIAFGQNLSDTQNLKVEQLPAKVVANDHLKEMSPILTVEQFEGVPIYVREGETIKFNPELLNVCSYEMLCFLESYVIAKYEGLKLSLTSFYKLHKADQNSSFRKSNETAKYLYDPKHQEVYKTSSTIIPQVESEDMSMVYAKNFINFHNQVLAEYPHLSMLEIWSKYFDLALSQDSEEIAIDEDILSLFSDADIEFMDYYRGCKKANNSLNFKVIENSYVKNHAGRYRTKK